MNTNKKMILFCVTALLAICLFVGVKGTSQNKGKDSAEVTGGITAVSDEAVMPDADAASDSSVGSLETKTKREKENGDESNEKEDKKDSDEESGTKRSEVEKKDSKDKKTSENQPAVKKADQKVSGTEQKTGSGSSGKAQKKKVEPDGQNKTTAEPSVVPAEPSATVTASENKNECLLTVTCEEVFSHMDKLSESAKKVIPADGIILRGTYEISEGETVFDLLKRACAGKNILLDYVFTPVYSTYYIKGINNLYEFDCGDESGWLYSVNGTEPGYGCSQYKLKKGDKVVFHYTCEYK